MTLYSILKELAELLHARFAGQVELYLENGRIVEIKKREGLKVAHV